MLATWDSVVGRITKNFVAQFLAWDRTSRTSFVLAGVLMVALVLFGRGLPDELRQNALIAIAGLFIVMQGIFLYANRGMVSALTAAQRQYLSEDFDGARQTLESALASAQKTDFRVLTLLGNTYRQLGLADESHDILTKAVQAAPQHHFSWYGFGRTLMTLGRYAEAVEAFERSRTLGAPSVVCLDHAEALYRSGASPDKVTQALQATPPQDEPYRTLWAAYLRWQIAGESIPSRVLIDEGIPYWRAVAQRFVHTPYGGAIAADLALLEEAE